MLVELVDDVVVMVFGPTTESASDVAVSKSNNSTIETDVPAMVRRLAVRPCMVHVLPNVQQRPA
jgi:hypothetical protein